MSSRTRFCAICLPLLFALSGCSADEPHEDTEPGKTSRKDASDDVGDQDDEAASDGSTKTRERDGGIRADDSCASIRQDAPAVRGAVDVVWLIDTSGSMWDDFAQIQQNLARFMQELDGSSADIRVVMVTGIDPAAGTALGGDGARYRFVASPVESRLLYSVALLTLPFYKDFLRPDAATHFVMVTDDEDRLSASEFRTEMERGLGHPFTLHAIASEDAGGRPCASAACGGVWLPLVCGAVAIGKAYNTLADQTGGGKLSICSDDWTSVITRLSEAVIAAVPLPCSYPLERASRSSFDSSRVQVVYTPEGADDEEFPKAKGEDQCDDARGWHFDDERSPTEVILCPAACEQVQQGGSIDIAFGCTPTTVI
jgi:hypothetical protein